MSVRQLRAVGLVAVAFGACLTLADLSTRSVWAANLVCGGIEPDVSIAGCTVILDRGTKESKHDRAVAHYNRGTAYYAKGLLDLAIKDFGNAIELKPDYVESYDNRGTAYYMKGDYDRAIADYTKAIGFRPNDP